MDGSAHHACLYQCNKVSEMIELVAGSLQYTNLRVASWIQENMDYEAVQDVKSKEAFEVDLQEAKVRLIVSSLSSWSLCVRSCIYVHVSSPYTYTHTHAHTASPLPL